MSEYSFPQLFVEGVDSERIICLKNSEYTWVSITEKNNCTKYYGSIPYEEILRYIDLEKAVLKRSTILFNPREPSKALFFSENTQLCLQEARGRRVFYIGSMKHVRKNDLIAYIVTGKNEVRNIYSTCEGFILAVIDLTWERPERIIVVMAIEQPGEIIIR